MRCCRCGRFTSRAVWVFTSRYRVTDDSRHTWGPGFDPIHFACLRRSTITRASYRVTPRRHELD